MASGQVVRGTLLDTNPYFLKHRFISRPLGAAVRGNGNLNGNPFARAVYGGAGIDMITGWDGHDYYLDGGAGHDTIDGGGDHDWINGGAGNDTLIGGPGHDILYGNRGQDTMDGGSGNDHLRSRRFGQDYGLYEFSPGVWYDFDGDNTLKGGADNDLLEGGFGNETLYGDDNLDPSASGNDIVIGWSGHDLIDGGPGNDVLYGDHAARAYSMHDNESFRSNQLIRELFPDFRNRQRFMRDGQFIPDYERSPNNRVTIPIYGNDVLLGGAGNDRLYGEAGDDTLDGGADRDRLEGGTGNDTYIINDRLDTIIEQVNQGIDTVKASISNYQLGRNVENLTLTGTRNIRGSGNELHNLVRGNRGSNTLWGNTGNDTLLGGVGNDILVGANGYSATPTREVDVLIGQEGRDTFVLGIGGAGSPGWRGGERPRVLYDDGQSNTSGHNSYALIDDFTNGQDRIQLRGRSQDYRTRSYLTHNGQRLISGTGIYLDQAQDELIAIVEHGNGIGPGQLNLANRNQFTFV